MSTAVPTVNVLMTYDPNLMIAFQQAASLAVFRENTSEVDSYIFNNAPESNFLSLTHEFGQDSGGEAEGGETTSTPSLVLEFVDPRGLFDSNVDFSPTTLIDTKTDLIAQQLKKKRAEALGLFNQSYHISSNPLFPILPKSGFCELVSNSVDLEWLQASVNELEQEIKDLEDLTLGETVDLDDELGGTQALRMANKLIWAHNKQLQRPVYITYGIGDNLADWCPPMVFNKSLGMEFSFNATGGRVMKVIYSGVSDWPLLTPMGIMPLETIGLGAVINGTSRRLFNGTAQRELQKDYPYSTGAVGNPEEVDPKRVVKPDLHKIITDTIKDFLEKAINAHKPSKASNVVVLFPNLEILLSGYYNAEYVAVKASNSDGTEGGESLYWSTDEEVMTGDMVWNIETTCEVLEGLGFTISCSKNGYKGRVGDSIYNELERQVDDIAVFSWLAGGRAVSYEYDYVAGAPTGAHPASPESVLAWLGDRDIRCEMQTDGLMKSVGNTVDDIGNLIKDRIMEYSTAKNSEGETEAVPALDIIRYIETDYETLRILHKHGLIDDPTHPALIFGDGPTIREILDGGLFEMAIDLKKKYPNWDVTVDEAVSEGLNTWGHGTAGSLSRYDIEDGWSSEVVRDMYDLMMPIPWLGPFGPTGNMNENMENFLPQDVNLDSDSWTVLKEEQPDTAARVPIFSFGTKNPNILQFNYDINNQYYSLMDGFDFINMSSYQRTNAILGSATKEAEEACNLLSKVNHFQSVNFKGPKVDGIPLAFVHLIQPMWERLQVSQGGSAVGSADWEKIFTSLNIPLVEDLSGKEFENRTAYIAFMWKAFCALTNGDYKRFQVQQSGVNNVGGALTRWANASNKLADMTIKATIKTIPMFHLSNQKRVVNRQALLLGIEPRYSGIDKSVIVPTSTWFSGLYSLTGFKHTLSKDAVHSEFSLNKPGNTGGYLKSGY